MNPGAAANHGKVFYSEIYFLSKGVYSKIIMMGLETWLSCEEQALCLAEDMSLITNTRNRQPAATSNSRRADTLF